MDTVYLARQQLLNLCYEVLLLNNDGGNQYNYNFFLLSL